MIIGDRLRALREEKNLSQCDIEKRTGLVRPYISRIENNHTVPAIETLEKMARALEIPMYQLFYDGDEPPELANLLKRKWGSTVFSPKRRRKPGPKGPSVELIHAVVEMKQRNPLSETAAPSIISSGAEVYPMRFPRFVLAVLGF